MKTAVHFSSVNSRWETPQETFDDLNREFRFTLDACAESTTAKVPLYFDETVDALSQPWEGRVFCNPPYGRSIGDWVEKGYRESLNGSTVVMLLPSRTDTKWWHEWVMRATEIRFIRGRLRFGNAENGAPFPSCVVIF